MSDLTQFIVKACVLFSLPFILGSALVSCVNEPDFQNTTPKHYGVHQEIIEIEGHRIALIINSSGSLAAVDITERKVK